VVPQPPGFELLGAGYDPTFDWLEPGQPHTIADLRGYLTDYLGSYVLDQAVRVHVLILVGEGRENLDRLRSAGWTVDPSILNPKGFHQCRSATAPWGGQYVAIFRVNGRDRLGHLQTLLKLAGVPSSNVLSVGRTRSYSEDYEDTFERLGGVPDLAVYGYCNSSLHRILTILPANREAHFPLFDRQRAHRQRRLRDDQHDLTALPLQEVVFAGGKKVWFLSDLYGDLVVELLEALADHGVRRLVAMGTAGALRGNIVLGAMLTPVRQYAEDQSIVDLDYVAPIQGVPWFGTYSRVSNPNLETVAWTERMITAGVDVIETEMGYVFEVLRRRRDLQGSVVLLVSDILTGPKVFPRRAWGTRDTLTQLGDFNLMLGNVLGFRGNQEYRVESYRVVPLVEGAEWTEREPQQSLVGNR